ncbi:MAG: 50S ribosomal protein L34, partial [Coriobacteriales bacterium]|nr:50S ribosomal protein L34 [Coriobacteriales bacterium]
VLSRRRAKGRKQLTV